MRLDIDADQNSNCLDTVFKRRGEEDKMNQMKTEQSGVLIEKNFA
jgi:hypothetical protein